MIGGRGGGGVNKAVAAGLLGLQLLSMPLTLVSSGRPAGSALPGVDVVPAAAQAREVRPTRQPRTVEEEMIREFLPCRSRFLAALGFGFSSVLHVQTVGFTHIRFFCYLQRDVHVSRSRALPA